MHISLFLSEIEPGTMIRFLAKTVFHLIGWKVRGDHRPDLTRKVLIVAPHTSSWDVPIGLLVKTWKKIDVTFYAKKELFKGILGWFLTKLGAAPVDRSKNNNLVGQIVHDFATKEHHSVLLTPEGTRKKVERFKTGFYFVADTAKVPIIPVQFNFKKKEVYFMDPYYTSGDREKEIKEIENMFRGIPGKIEEYSF